MMAQRELSFRLRLPLARQLLRFGDLGGSHLAGNAVSGLDRRITRKTSAKSKRAAA
jgi:hypothetical protein